VFSVIVGLARAGRGLVPRESTSGRCADALDEDRPAYSKRFFMLLRPCGVLAYRVAGEFRFSGGTVASVSFPSLSVVGADCARAESIDTPRTSETNGTIKHVDDPLHMECLMMESVRNL
jgi:hypothetical protein